MKLRKSYATKMQYQASLNKNNVKSNRLPWTQSTTGINRPSGKGRFGKRATSICFDYERNTNDNSNDSGFECDWSNQSESQTSWNTSTEDLHQLHNSSSLISIIPKLSSSHCMEVSRDSVIPKSQISKEFVKNVGLYLPMKKTNEELPENNFPFLLGKSNNMSPDSTMPSSTMSSRGSNETMSSPVSTNSNDGGSPTIPMKRPRFCFSSPSPSKQTGLKLRNQNGVQSMRNSSLAGKRLPPGTTPTLTSPLSAVSRDGRVHLQILAQPEEQHRARYQTEGSRGAIKDRKCNGFPTIKLFGYDKPATLQIFIGTDQGKVSPHMFYQACKVTGKSSTPCIEKKVEGTVLIEIEFEPSKDMVISCDCVGILKERNVDVEQRFPFHHAAQSRKKSTKCRMIFRTTIVNQLGVEETLQVSSLPILCTQPPGQPEICKQSLYECSANGGQELFIIGKNFLKDTKIVIQEEDDHGEILWEAKSIPLKDYLQQTHLISVIPPYKDEGIASPVDCKVSVCSGGKLSEPVRFTYFPISAGEATLTQYLDSFLVLALKRIGCNHS